MPAESYSVQRWKEAQPPTESEILSLFIGEALAPYRWSNAPGDIYSAHTHPFHKIIYVVEGSIVFGLPVEGEEISLEPGDRLDLAPEVVHDAVVGPQGVVCLEAHR